MNFKFSDEQQLFLSKVSEITTKNRISAKLTKMHLFLLKL